MNANKFKLVGIFAAVATTFAAVSASAQGGSGAGGGGGVNCPMISPNTVTLDYHQATLKKIGVPTPPIMDLSGSEDDIIDRFADALATVGSPSKKTFYK